MDTISRVLCWMNKRCACIQEFLLAPPNYPFAIGVIYKKKRRIIVYECTSLSFIQHKDLTPYKFVIKLSLTPYKFHLKLILSRVIQGLRN